MRFKPTDSTTSVQTEAVKSTVAPIITKRDKMMRRFNPDNASICREHNWKGTFDGEPRPACSYYNNKSEFDKILSQPEHNKLAPIKITPKPHKG